MDSQRQFPPLFSCEFFPPNNAEAAEKLQRTRAELERLNPSFFSVTYGAGGSTQSRTLETVLRIQDGSTIEAAPHLTCIASSRESVRELLNCYRGHGVRRVVALRGDVPSGMYSVGEFRYASQLVEFIRAETGDYYHIEVGAYPEFHPQSESADQDVQNFKRKVDAGADSAITQYFFSADAYFRYIDSCEKMGIDIPIIPGIMPITNFKQLCRFSDMCGAEIPRWIRRRLEGMADDRASLVAFGVEVVSDLCRRLLEEGAPGLHFYTMNQSAPTLAIWRQLGLPVKN